MISSIMVSLALDHPNKAALAVAGDLAEKTRARVIGVAAAEFSPPLYFTSGRFGQQLVAAGEKDIRERLDRCEADFRAALGHRAVSLEWRAGMKMPASYVAEQARAADLIVTGRGGRRLTDPFSHADPDDLVMHAGRPLLVVPEKISWLDLRRGLVAWKDTAEARRVVSAALPLLRLIENVTVAEIVEGNSNRDHAEARVRDVAAWLGTHGIAAGAVVPVQTDDASGQLARLADELGAGLIFAGAYGHSRFREWVLGGVTRLLVSQSGRCAFMMR